MDLFDDLEPPSEAPAIERNRLYLIDAMALAYRSHFVFISRPLINSRGQNTSATYGFTLALIKLIEDHGIDNIAVVFDAIGEKGTFRDEMYDQYKAHRAPIPEDLVANLPYIKEVVKALDIPVVEIEGVEADDVIGTLAQRAEQDGASVVIVSPDKDFQQLLTPAIQVFRPAHRGEEFDPITVESFQERFGLEPSQFIDVLALMGDASDNVPGVPGIGEKTAVQLIQEYGSVENLLNHAEQVKGKKAREGLLAHSQDATLSKALVTIKTDVDLDLDWQKCRRKEMDEQRLTQLFKELEFSSLFNRVQRIARKRPVEVSAEPDVNLFGEPATPVLDEDLASLDDEAVDYRSVVNRADLEALVNELATYERFALDTETTNIDPMWASLVGISLSWAKGQGRYIPTPMPDGTSIPEVLALLGPVLQGKKIVGQNLKYDLVVLDRHDLHVEADFFDTMVAHYLLAPEETHNLDALARRYLNYRMVPISDLIGSGKTQISMRDVPISKVARYSCEDADISLQLADLFEAELEKNQLAKIAHGIEMPLMRVLCDMELAGITVDPAMLKEISRQLRDQILQYEQEIYKAAGLEFNIGSTKQLSEVLFDRLGLKTLSKTSTGKPSTNETVLQELSTEHPLPGLILDWRRVSKLKSTYVDALAGLIHPSTGRIHTSFNQTITATGRLSSSNPNLQNIPVRTEQGREIRKAFVATEGYQLLSADYVQIELRIIASMSGDEALSQAFIRGEDIHTATAALVYGVAPEWVTRDMRRKAKEVNYGIPYGVSAFGLAQRLRTPVREAQELIDQYQRSYPKVASFLVHLTEEARKKGYAETLLGRRRYIPNINARNRTERGFAERVAVNMPIQGTQADMIKIAMVRLHERLVKERLKTRMLLQVHDELLFEVPPEETDTIRAMVREEMVGALPLNVPVEVEIGIGDNWLDAH